MTQNPDNTGSDIKIVNPSKKSPLKKPIRGEILNLKVTEGEWSGEVDGMG